MEEKKRKIIRKEVNIESMEEDGETKQIVD
jgi:hypothetical protein